jgi:hypothetical protein
MLADTLRDLAGTRLVDEDGEEHVLELLPPATESEVELVEAESSLRLPTELREALSVSAGFANGPLESLGFLDLAGFGMEDVFPGAHPLAHDGYGNYWVLDLVPGEDACGPVFYACHDPPVIAFQSSNPSDFLRDVVALWQPGPRSPIDVVHEDVTSAIWASNAGLVSQEELLASGDPAAATFAADFPPQAVFADLRAARVGDGFPWGRYGPQTAWTRAGPDRLWATVPPPPRRGLLARFFGRGGRR